MSEVLVRVPLDEERTRWVVVSMPAERAAEEGLELAARRDGIREAQETFESATAAVTPAAESLLQRLKQIGDPPSEIEVEFGLALSFKAGAIIASSEASSNFTIRLKWVRDPS